MRPEIPRMTNKLKLLLPMILANTISWCPSRLPITLTTSSGVEVPKATIVKPMAKSETLNFLARAVAPSTSQSAPLMRRMSPSVSHRIGISIFIDLN
jgi:hypothetical protein